MTHTQVKYDGRCMCGAVHFVAQGDPTYVGHCHCDDCRRATGGVSVAWFGVNPANFEVVKGTMSEHQSSPGIFRGFCSDCGSSLTFRGQGWDDIGVTIASLDDPNCLTPNSNVYISEKLHWVPITAGTRNYDGFPA
ncbi:GFA family protein [Shimia sp.]|uniref:GFA family protein n=1 Tax=Shimia sp. TaxID=1954381 RepID=UPI0032988670